MYYRNIQYWKHACLILTHIVLYIQYGSVFNNNNNNNNNNTAAATAAAAAATATAVAAAAATTAATAASTATATATATAFSVLRKGEHAKQHGVPENQCLR